MAVMKVTGWEAEAVVTDRGIKEAVLEQEAVEKRLKAV